MKPVLLRLLDDAGRELTAFWFRNRDAALEYVVSMGVFNFSIREVEDDGVPVQRAHRPSAADINVRPPGPWDGNRGR